jgi:hypothetical protein
MRRRVILAPADRNFAGGPGVSITLLQFETPLTDGADIYVARACGRALENGQYEGWIEFEPPGGGATLRTARETTQPNLSDLEYWATGLSAVYLDGALRRAKAPLLLTQPAAPAPPTFEEPAPPFVRHAEVEAPLARPVLDPFVVYAQGEPVLRSQLDALSLAHLEVLARAYAPDALPNAPRVELVEAIVAAARAQSRASRAALEENGRAELGG